MSANHGYLIACILGSLILGGRATSCQEDEMPKFTSCANNFQRIRADMVIDSQNNPSGQNAVLQAICSDEGKAAMLCFFEVIQRCPDLAQGPGANMMLPGVNITQIMKQGGVDLMCGMISGPCSSIQRCFRLGPRGSPGGGEPEPDMSGVDMTSVQKYMTTQATAFNEVKSYLFFQGQVDTVCGIMRPIMECIKTELEKCPELKEQVNKRLGDMIKQSTTGLPQGVRILTFKEQQDFIKNECPNVPKGFTSNKCLQEQLMSAEFSACHMNFSATYQKKADKQQCAAYDALENCFKEHVQPTCGSTMSSFMAKNTPLLVQGLDSACVHHTSGSNTPMAASIMLLTSAVTLVATAFRVTIT